MGLLGIGHEQEVDDIEGFVRLEDDQRPPAGRMSHGFSMMNGKLTPVRQVEDERPKGLVLIKAADRFDRHTIVCSASARFRLNDARRGAGRLVI